MKSKSYYFVKVRLGGGWHVVKAYSEEDALRIRKKFGIAFPWGSKVKIKNIVCKRIDMRMPHNKDLIWRRKQGFGGSIWYEDDKGELQKET